MHLNLYFYVRACVFICVAVQRISCDQCDPFAVGSLGGANVLNVKWLTVNSFAVLRVFLLVFEFVFFYVFELVFFYVFEFVFFYVFVFI